jgi:hypothetical protein
MSSTKLLLYASCTCRKNIINILYYTRQLQYNLIIIFPLRPKEECYIKVHSWAAEDACDILATNRKEGGISSCTGHSRRLRTIAQERERVVGKIGAPKDYQGIYRLLSFMKQRRRIWGKPLLPALHTLFSQCEKVYMYNFLYKFCCYKLCYL